jgi:GT2 family glycosyltransferase
VGYGLRITNPLFAVEWMPRKSDRPFESPMLPGACMLLRSDVFRECRGFDAGMTRWGCEDTELSLHLWTFGYDLYVVPEVTVEHLFRERHPYAVEWVDTAHNALRAACVNFNERRLGSVIETVKGTFQFGAAVARLVAGDAQLRRAEIQGRRRRGDDAYFERFGDIV